MENNEKELNMKIYGLITMLFLLAFILFGTGLPLLVEGIYGMFVFKNNIDPSLLSGLEFSYITGIVMTSIGVILGVPLISIFYRKFGLWQRKLFKIVLLFFVAITLIIQILLIINFMSLYNSGIKTYFGVIVDSILMGLEIVGIIFIFLRYNK